MHTLSLTEPPATTAVATGAAPCQTVAEAIIDVLEQHAVSSVYGIISIHNLPLADAIGRGGKIRFIPARGEAGAASMADANSRLNGLGVVITSTGAGAGNAAGGLMEALNAGSPVLHLTGQVEREYLDRDAGFIHETRDQPSLLRGCSKAVFRIVHPQQATAIIARAIETAQQPPKGPVSVEIPIDVQAALITPPCPLPAPTPRPLAVPASTLNELAEALSAARRPVFWVGGGALTAVESVRAWADRGVAVISSTHGRGILADSHPSSLRAFHHAPEVAQLLAESDLLIVAGSRLRSNETTTYSLQLPSQIIQIDLDPAACNRNYVSSQFVQADCQQVLSQLLQAVPALPNLEAGRQQAIQYACQAAEQRLRQQLGVYAELNDAVRTALPASGMLVRDITMAGSTWGSRLFACEQPLHNIHSLAGAIGMGLPMAIGCAVARPHSKVLALVGDGGLMLGIGELATLAQEQLNVTVLIMNNGGYGVMREIQAKHFGDRQYFNQLLTPDFTALAQSIGLPAWKLSHPSQFNSVLAEAMAMNGPSVIEVDMSPLGPLQFAGPPQKKLY